MNTIIDFHTHTIASGHHTTDTVTKMAEEAKKRGLRYLCVTDHAPKMPGAASVNYFRNLKYADKTLYGVKIFYGAELNVLNASGEVDLPEDVLRELDFAIASLHKDVIKPQSEEVNTSALINAMKNPYVDIIGHPTDPTFKVNFHLLTDAAKENGVALELNSAGIDESGYREKNPDGVREMLELCKRKGVYITLGSDSHGREKIGDFEESEEILKELNFPEKLILNKSPEEFLARARQKRNR